MPSSTNSPLLVSIFSLTYSLKLSCVLLSFSFSCLTCFLLPHTCLHFFLINVICNWTGLWSDSPVSSSTFIPLICLCLNYFVIINPSSSYQVPLGMLNHVPLRLWPEKLFRYAIPFSCHQFSRSGHPPSTLSGLLLSTPPPSSFHVLLPPDFPVLPAIVCLEFLLLSLLSVPSTTCHPFFSTYPITLLNLLLLFSLSDMLWRFHVTTFISPFFISSFCPPVVLLSLFSPLPLLVRLIPSSPTPPGSGVCFCFYCEQLYLSLPPHSHSRYSGFSNCHDNMAITWTSSNCHDNCLDMASLIAIIYQLFLRTRWTFDGGPNMLLIIR